MFDQIYKKTPRLILFLMIIFLTCQFRPINVFATGSIEIASVSSSGDSGNSGSEAPDISADGRYVVFQSAASNLVAGDTNGFSDVFVRDRQTGITERVSVVSDGSQSNGGSGDYPVISGDGRYVAFYSSATNLVAGDTNGKGDVFVHDRQTGTTERINIASDGSQSNDGATYFSISGDGRYVAFYSSATNLVAGDTNGKGDVFVHDRQTGITKRVSITSNGNQSNNYSSYSSISADGRFVAFQSSATNLVSGDTNGSDDIFVHDRQTGTTQRINVTSNGSQSNATSNSHPSISADGRFIAFQSNATNLISGTFAIDNIYRYDRQTGLVDLVSKTPVDTMFTSPSVWPDISADGRFVTFFVYNYPQTNIINVYIHNLQINETRIISVGLGNTQGNGYSWYPAISKDGKFITFRSEASNLVQNDINGFPDVFVADNPLFINSPPTVDAGGPYQVNEGDSIQVSATGNVPENDSLTYVWDLDNDGSFETPGQSVNFSAANLDGPDTKTITVQVTDNGNLTATDQATVNVNNVSPSVGVISAPTDPVLINTNVNTSASFTDLGVADTHTAVWDWEDTTNSSGTVTETNGSGTVSGSHSYTTPGVYEVKVTVSDDDSGSGESVYQYVVVYDSSANGGFVTGAGTIDSPSGAYTPTPSLTGIARFGFVSKYQPGANTPTGDTQFKFQVAGFTFSSTSYQWLVVAGAQAKFKGDGTVNSNGNYGFQLSATDGAINGGGGIDKFRIKIWDKNNNDSVIYDNQLGASDNSNPATAISGGNIIIH